MKRISILLVAIMIFLGFILGLGGLNQANALDIISDDIFYDSVANLYWYRSPLDFNSYDRTSQSTAIDALNLTTGGYLYDQWRWASQVEVYSLLYNTSWSTNWRGYFNGWDNTEVQGFSIIRGRSADSPDYSDSDTYVWITEPAGTWNIIGWMEFDSTYNVSAWVVTDSRSSTSVPEPATMLLFSAGLAGLGVMRKRMKIS